MKLKTLIRQARSTKFRQLSEDSFTDEVLVDYINLGMIELYKLYQLKTEEAIVTLGSGDTEYSLDGTDPDVSMGSSAEVMQIISAFDEKREIGVNNSVDDFGIFTISHDKIQVPVVSTGDYISVIYKPYPDEIEFVDDGNGNATDTDIDIPKGLGRCLIDYMAYLAHDSIDESDSEKYYQEFVRSCENVSNVGLVITDSVGIDIYRKGALV